MLTIVKSFAFVSLGILLTAFGLKLLSASSLTFGGTAGVAILLAYSTPLPWGFWFVAANAPFLLLSYRALGARFTASTLLAIVGTSFARQLLDGGMAVPSPAMPPLAAALAAGLSIGIGIAFVLNNGSSLGGVQIFALVLDRKFGINRGATIFASDAAIVLSAAFLLGWDEAVASIVSIAVASFLIGRYRRGSEGAPSATARATAGDRDEAALSSACSSRTSAHSGGTPSG